jgi:plasmid stability protein
MGQINVYFPEDLEKEIRSRAEREQKSLSAVIIEITQKELKPSELPASFWEAVGSIKEDEFIIEKLPLRELSED